MNFHKIKTRLTNIGCFHNQDIRCSDIEFSATINIIEATEYENSVTLHGVLISDKCSENDHVEITIKVNNGCKIGEVKYSYEDNNFLKDEYDQDTKRAMVFSIKFDNSHAEYEIIAYKNKSNAILAKRIVSNADIKKLILRSQINNPTFDQRLNLLNQTYENMKASKEILDQQRKAVFKTMPKFSIVVPLYNTPENLFREMLESVLNQSYSKFELILVDASPESAELKRLVSSVTKKDLRVKTIELASNKGIMKNTNAGIENATGDYICFLDHDDVLEPDILFHYAKAINDNKNDVGLLYCDDAILDENGSIAGTFLVGDFSIDALLHRNYIGHMLAIRKDILQNIDTNTDKFDGAQDHYMSLMTSLQSNNIVHINRPLYKWRRTNSSTSANPASKNYATDAGVRAVQSYLDLVGIKGIAKEANRPFSYTISYEISTDSSITAIIDTTKSMRNINYTIDSIKTLLQGKVTEIYIIGSKSNNANLDARLSDTNNIYYINTQNKNDYANQVNSLVNKFKSLYLLFIDCNIHINNENQISVLLERIQREDIGAVGPMLVYPDNTIASAGMVVSLPKPNDINRGISVNDTGYMDFNDCEQNYSSINGLCIITRKCDFISVGGFSEDYIENYYDVDYCLKLRKINKLIAYTPTSRLTYYGKFLIHTIENKTATIQELSDRVNLINNWKEFFENGDPYINDCFKNTENGAFCFIPYSS